MTGLHQPFVRAVDFIVSQEFGFVRLDDTPSAPDQHIMPQKKNPDTLELTRVWCGQLSWLIIGSMTTLKGLPSTYKICRKIKKASSTR